MTKARCPPWPAVERSLLNLDAMPAPTLHERITETMREITAAQEKELRRIALQLLGQDTGDPEAIINGLQEHIRKWVGPEASLVLCSVVPQALPPGVLGRWWLAIDTGKEGTVPVRIGPPYQITDGGIRP